MLMNLILVKENLVPTVVQVKDSSKYFEALRAADAGNITQFVQFIAESTKNTIDSMLGVTETLRGGSSTRGG